MASIFSVSVSKIYPAGCLIRLCKTLKNYNVTQVAFMVRSAYKEPRNKPAPFPYWKKKYTFLNELLDPMVHRFDENTKLVVVEGPPAVGKSKICEQLANEFGLLYMPAPTQDDLYINEYGFDVRELDSQLPFYAKSFDVPRFLENPNDKRTAMFQISYFYMRFEQYTNALLHLLSTGQGVVLNRCVYSDIVFAQAMTNAGYLSKDVFKNYTHSRRIGINYLLRPNLIIYLDVPVELVKEKIREKGKPYEVNSKVFSTQFLTDIENTYKEKYLKELAGHTHLLIYDWSKEGDSMIIVEDIENIDLEDYTNEKQEDWKFNSVSEIQTIRRRYDRDQFHMFQNMCEFPTLECPRELYLDSEENSKLEEVLDNCPSEQYEPGFNPHYDNTFWKIPKRQVFQIRRTPRDFVNRDKYMS